MTFLLSKLLWFLVAPANFLLLLLVAGLFWRRLLYVAVAAFLAVAILPIGAWLALPLEERHEAPPLPGHVAGIVVLGGALDGAISAARGQPAINEAAERITESVRLARRYPDARLLYSGGDPYLLPRGHSEAAAAVALFESLGIARERLLIEEKARNTWENALYSKDLARPAPDETWVLVTSASHMPRALGCFRRIGWEVLPWPVDYRVDPTRVGLDFALAGQLSLLTIVLKEWIGLAAYWMLDRI